MDYNYISDLYTSIDVDLANSFDSSSFIKLEIELNGRQQDESNEIASLVSYFEE